VYPVPQRMSSHKTRASRVPMRYVTSRRSPGSVFHAKDDPELIPHGLRRIRQFAGEARLPRLPGGHGRPGLY